MTPEALDALVASGATVEMIAAAWKAEIACEDNRSPAAKRQARYRERVTERNEASQNVTCDADVTEPPFLDKESFPQTPFKEINLTPVCIPRTRGAVKFVLPNDIPAEPWNGFVEMRRQQRKPMSERAMDLAVTKLRKLRDEDGWPPGDILDHCTLNNYQGLWPPKREIQNGHRTANSRSDEPRNPMVRAALKHSAGGDNRIMELGRTTEAF